MPVTRNRGPVNTANDSCTVSNYRPRDIMARQASSPHRKPSGTETFTPEEQELLLDLSQIMLDIIGIFEPTPFADGTNAAISFQRGDELGGWIGLISMVPYLGDLAKVGKFPKYTTTFNRIIKYARNNPTFARIIRPRLEEVSDLLDLLSGLQNAIGRSALETNTALRKYLGKAANAIKGGLRGGMLPRHYKAVLRIAKERGLVIMFRNTDEACEKYIKKGFPPKPVEIKAKTKAGIATAADQSEIDEAIEAGMMVIGKDGKSILHRPPGSNKVLVEPLPPEITKISGYQPLQGHIIHPNLKQPFTGDYDLLAIVDPKDFHSNAVGIRMGGSSAKSLSNPFDQDVISALNKAIGEKRVVHGTWEHFRPLSEGKAVTVFLPDGKSTLSFHAGSKEFKQFFNSFGQP